MKNWLRQKQRIFTSTRTALFLMLIVCSVIVYGITVSENVFKSVWFAIPSGLLAINTFLCTMKQFSSAMARFAKAGEINSILKVRLPYNNSIIVGDWFVTSEKAAEDVRKVFRYKGYKTSFIKYVGYSGDSSKETETFTVVGHRWSIGYFGAPLFHLGIFAIILGGLISGMTRSVDQVVLTEKGKIQLKPTFFSVGPPETIALQETSLDFNEKGKLKEWSAMTNLSKGNKTISQEINSEKRLVSGSATIDIGANGYTPGFIITQRGREVGRIRVHLNAIPQKNGYRHEDNFILPGDNPDRQRLNVNFWPNFIISKGMPSSQGEAPLNPAVTVSLRDQTGEESKTIKLGETAVLGEWGITFDHYRPWLMLEITRDPGYFGVILGLWLFIFGLGIMFFMIPRQITAEICVENGKIMAVLRGKSYRFQHSLSYELDRIAEKFRQSDDKGRGKDGGD